MQSGVDHHEGSGKLRHGIFWLFGTLQSFALAALIFVIFESLSRMSGARVIGRDSQIVLSVAFPLFLLAVEYVIYRAVSEGRGASGRSEGTGEAEH